MLDVAFTDAEFLVNSRPLTHIPISCIDDEVLTPFHALIGRAGTYAPPFTPTTGENEREQWKRVQHFSRMFWNRWKKEYLPTLLKRNKNTNKVEPIKVGDIVSITDDEVPQGKKFAKKAPPGKWLKGRVIETTVAKNGQVRQAVVQTIRGRFKRPAVKIAVLDIQGTDDENSSENVTTPVVDAISKTSPETATTIDHTMVIAEETDQSSVKRKNID